jgi:predicted  nucleic acid-binding Zn-ribbon protein
MCFKRSNMRETEFLLEQLHKIEMRITARLDIVLQKLDDLERKEDTMSKEIDLLKSNIATLVADVAAEKTVIDSAVAAISGLTSQQAVLSQQLADAIAANDPAAIQAAADAIAAQNQAVVDATAALAAAIPASTPAAAPTTPAV